MFYIRDNYDNQTKTDKCAKYVHNKMLIVLQKKKKKSKIIGPVYEPPVVHTKSPKQEYLKELGFFLG